MGRVLVPVAPLQHPAPQFVGDHLGVAVHRLHARDQGLLVLAVAQLHGLGRGGLGGSQTGRSIGRSPPLDVEAVGVASDIPEIKTLGDARVTGQRIHLGLRGRRDRAHRARQGLGDGELARAVADAVLHGVRQALRRRPVHTLRVELDPDALAALTQREVRVGADIERRVIPRPGEDPLQQTPAIGDARLMEHRPRRFHLVCQASGRDNINRTANAALSAGRNLTSVDLLAQDRGRVIQIGLARQKPRRVRVEVGPRPQHPIVGRPHPERIGPVPVDVLLRLIGRGVIATIIGPIILRHEMGMGELTVRVEVVRARRQELVDRVVKLLGRVVLRVDLHDVEKLIEVVHVRTDLVSRAFGLGIAVVAAHGLIHGVQQVAPRNGVVVVGGVLARDAVFGEVARLEGALGHLVQADAVPVGQGAVAPAPGGPAVQARHVPADVVDPAVASDEVQQVGTAVAGRRRAAPTQEVDRLVLRGLGMIQGRGGLFRLLVDRRPRIRDVARLGLAVAGEWHVARERLVLRGLPLRGGPLLRLTSLALGDLVGAKGVRDLGPFFRRQGPHGRGRGFTRRPDVAAGLARRPGIPIRPEADELARRHVGAPPIDDDRASGGVAVVVDGGQDVQSGCVRIGRQERASAPGPLLVGQIYLRRRGFPTQTLAQGVLVLADQGDATLGVQGRVVPVATTHAVPGPLRELEQARRPRA